MGIHTHRTRPDGVDVNAKTTAAIRLERRREPYDSGGLVFGCLWPKNGVNLGTLARTADALNARIAVPMHSNASRALRQGNTIGTRNTLVEWVDDVREWVRTRPGPIVAVELAESAIPLVDLWPMWGATVLLGHETGGVPRWALDAAEVVVEIPMRGVGNSLNVAVAGSLVGYKLAGLS